MRKIAFPFAFLLLLVACGSSPEGTVKSFFRNVEAGKLDAAAELFSKSTLSKVSLDKLKQGLQRSTREIDEKGGISKIEILDSKIIGEVAEVKVKLHYGDGTDDVESMDLIKEDGRWKLQPGADK